MRRIEIRRIAIRESHEPTQISIISSQGLLLVPTRIVNRWIRLTGRLPSNVAFYAIGDYLNVLEEGVTHETD